MALFNAEKPLMQLAPVNWQASSLQKYDAPAPRYTSYPSANQFLDSFNAKDYRQQLGVVGDNIAPLSLYLHVPFCRQNCFYCACNKIVTRDANKVQRYIEALRRELKLQGALHGRRRVTQLHWGGGTPTYLARSEMTQLMHEIGLHFNLDVSGEHDFSIEIDPRTVDVADIALLRGLGFNRVSLGIQDFHLPVQRLINRVQDYDQIEAITEAVRENGFDSLNFDLIYGLPGQTVETFKETLAKVVALSPDRIACYNYAHLPDRFPGQRAIDIVDLPPPEEKLALMQLCGEYLQAHGYGYIGMDHFVKPDDSLAVAARNGLLQRNFQGYSTVLAPDTLGLGPSSISQLGGMYVQNASSLNDYCIALELGELAIARGYSMNVDDQIRRDIIMSLACHLSLDINSLQKKYGISFFDSFVYELEELAPFVDDGLISIKPDGITVLNEGRLLIRSICMAFDAFHRDEASRKIFSRSI